MSKKDEFNQQLKSQKEEEALKQKEEEARSEEYQDIHDLVLVDIRAWAEGLTDITINNETKVPLARRENLPGVTTFSLSIGGPGKLTPMRILGVSHNRVSFADTAERARLMLYRNTPHQLVVLSAAQPAPRAKPPTAVEWSVDSFIDLLQAWIARGK